jgi:hypothetical protein
MSGLTKLERPNHYSLGELFFVFCDVRIKADPITIGITIRQCVRPCDRRQRVYFWLVPWLCLVEVSVALPDFVEHTRARCIVWLGCVNTQRQHLDTCYMCIAITKRHSGLVDARSNIDNK